MKNCKVRMKIVDRKNPGDVEEIEEEITSVYTMSDIGYCSSQRKKLRRGFKQIVTFHYDE